VGSFVSLICSLFLLAWFILWRPHSPSDLWRPWLAFLRAPPVRGGPLDWPLEPAVVFRFSGTEILLVRFKRSPVFPTRPCHARILPFRDQRVPWTSGKPPSSKRLTWEVLSRRRQIVIRPAVRSNTYRIRSLFLFFEGLAFVMADGILERRAVMSGCALLCFSRGPCQLPPESICISTVSPSSTPSPSFSDLFLVLLSFPPAKARPPRPASTCLTFEPC